MSERTMYKTKQREELIEYLKSTRHKHITVNDVCEYFKANNRNIGQTTVYRQLEKMASEGLVNKYIFEAGSPACFEYIDREKDCGESSCFHCKCEICGTLIHLHCDDLVDIQKHIKAEHGFSVDPLRTVFYGVCDRCRE